MPTGLALAVGSLLALPGAAPADVTITSDRTATNASAHHGQLVWSRVAGDGRSRLVRRPSTLEFTGQTFPGRVTTIAAGDGRLYYTNGRGLFEATNPGFAARD